MKRSAFNKMYTTRHRASTSTRWHFSFGLCFHSNKWMNPCTDCKSAQNAQLRGTPYHSPKLHPGPCSSVGVMQGTDRQTHRHTHRRPWPLYISCRLRLTRNVTNRVTDIDGSTHDAVVVDGADEPIIEPIAMILVCRERFTLEVSCLCHSASEVRQSLRQLPATQRLVATKQPASQTVAFYIHSAHTHTLA